ncbi:MAG: hypothetical protein HYZ29_20085 [Myxococcales bacterium]|nr:hypothetical protein [Myxococcales bacterium]
MLRHAGLLVALVAGCSVDLAPLQAADAGSSGGAGGAGGTGGLAGTGGSAGSIADAGPPDADAGDTGDASDPQVLCSVNFEAASCFSAYALVTSGNAHCGNEASISGLQSAYLEGGNSTSISQTCGPAPQDLWFEMLFERRTSGTVVFRVGGWVGAVGGAQVKVGADGNTALLECLDGKDQNQLLAAAQDTTYVLTLNVDPQGLASLWVRKKLGLVARGAAHAMLQCAPATKAMGWQAFGPAVTIIDDVRITDSPAGLLYP